MRLAWRPMAAGENGAWHSGSRGLLTRKRSLGLALQQEGGGRLLTWRSRRKASHSAKLDTRRPSPSLGNQPRRRPPSQQRPVGHHPDPVAHRPRHPRLRTTAHHPRQDHQEIMRLLKRYLAREIDPPTAPTRGPPLLPLAQKWEASGVQNSCPKSTSHNQPCHRVPRSARSSPLARSVPSSTAGTRVIRASWTQAAGAVAPMEPAHAAPPAPQGVIPDRAFGSGDGVGHSGLRTRTGAARPARIRARCPPVAGTPHPHRRHREAQG